MLLLFLSFVYSEIQLVDHPIRNIYTADPSAHVFPNDPDTLWLYPSHDVTPPKGYDTMDNYHVFSTKDLVNWTDYGVILGSSDLKWGIPTGGWMWAPDANKAPNADKYYFYFPHLLSEDWEDWRLGVAISDKPEGPFVDQGFPIPGVGGFARYDPCVFVDDDGSVFLYIGGGGQFWYGEMNQDMVSLKGEMKQITNIEDYNEGPFVFKRNNIYYMMHADGYKYDGEHQRSQQLYATATSPHGPWTNRGVLFGNIGSFTSHGSVVQFKGEWFLFYHDIGLSGLDSTRSVNIAKIEFNEDGTIVPLYLPAPEPPKCLGRPDNAVEYNATRYCEAGGSAGFEDIPGTDDRALDFLLEEDAFGTFYPIDGGASGGDAELWIRYSSLDGGFVKIEVDGTPYEAILGVPNHTWTEYTCYAKTDVKLLPGTENRVRIQGGYGGLNIASVLVKWK